MIINWFKNKQKSPAATTEVVEQYYETWTERYLDTGGDVIQAVRTTHIEDLLDYFMQGSDLQPGEKILDAGCGVCGPAIHFAKKMPLAIHGVTISQKQVTIAKEKIEHAGLQDMISVIKGDYHKLEAYFSPNFFDKVLFLESLGHAVAPDQVLKSTFKVLKPGGYLYIKDFYTKESDDPNEQKRILEVVANINRLYAYNTLDLHLIISTLRRIGFEIIFIKKPEFQDDTTIRALFEERFNINIFGKYEAFAPSDWLEIKCRKPEWL